MDLLQIKLLILSNCTSKKLREKTGLSDEEISQIRCEIRQITLPKHGNYVTCPGCNNKVKLPCLECVLTGK